MPSREPMPIQDAARAVLAKLEDRGWCKGGFGPNHEMCLGWAVNTLPIPARKPMRAAVFATAPCVNIAVWNDDPKTTWPDVKRVLGEIAAS